jgi:hypothetical protein
MKLAGNGGESSFETPTLTVYGTSLTEKPFSSLP